MNVPDICPRCDTEFTSGRLICPECYSDAFGTVHPRWFDHTYLARMTKEANDRHPMQDVIDRIDDLETAQ